MSKLVLNFFRFISFLYVDDQDAIEKELKRCKTECKMKGNSNKLKRARKGFDIKKPCDDKFVGIKK